MLTEPRYPPRLARLYSEEVRKLEAAHADRLSPGASTWKEAIEALHHGMSRLGPVKGAKLIGKAIDYLQSVASDARIHLVITADNSSKRAAHLMFFTFNVGPHPDPAIREEGLNIKVHVIICARAKPSWVSGIPVAYISRHAILRLYERGHDISENQTHGLCAFAGVLGYLTHDAEKHQNGGLNMMFSDVLVTGALHRCTKPYSSHRTHFFDVRTVLPTEEIGPGKKDLFEQGRVATSLVLEWFNNKEEFDRKSAAEKIPALPRHEDSYPARAVALALK